MRWVDVQRRFAVTVKMAAGAVGGGTYMAVHSHVGRVACHPRKGVPRCKIIPIENRIQNSAGNKLPALQSTGCPPFSYFWHHIPPLVFCHRDGCRYRSTYRDGQKTRGGRWSTPAAKICRVGVLPRCRPGYLLARLFPAVSVSVFVLHVSSRVSVATRDLSMRKCDKSNSFSMTCLARGDSSLVQNDRK